MFSQPPDMGGWLSFMVGSCKGREKWVISFRPGEWRAAAPGRFGPLFMARVHGQSSWPEFMARVHGRCVARCIDGVLTDL